MKNSILYTALSTSLLLGVGCQTKEYSVWPLDEVCSVEFPILDKADAKAALLGDWQWQQTRYPGQSRLTGVVPTETPRSTGHQLLFRFTADRYLILKDGNVVQDLPYEVRYWGEGTNTVDPILLVRTYQAATGFSGGSILRIDPGKQCLQLVNSYGDAGGDLSLKKTK
ncbi:hypothetical protein [Hymenobacter sp. B1770]|uniref:hypothetical protein n=1 Tax=Hymenobacter sp. B1770 TaxID=1718788 RepID=UPI003CF9B638